jgi:hypothetical protein
MHSTVGIPCLQAGEDVKGTGLMKWKWEMGAFRDLWRFQETRLAPVRIPRCCHGLSGHLKPLA